MNLSDGPYGVNMITGNTLTYDMGAEISSSGKQSTWKTKDRTPRRKYTKNDKYQAQMLCESIDIEYKQLCDIKRLVGDLGFAQMDEPAEDTVQQITEFQENEEHVTTMNVDVPIDMVSYKASLEAFLTRPFILNTTSWASTDTLGSQLYSLELPNAFYAIPTFYEKIIKFAFWKPSFEITIRINGTPMHYGRLLINYLPQASALSDSYKNMYTASSSRWIQVDANGSNVATIHVPFAYFKDMINIGKLNIDVATIYCWVTVPLNTINSVAPPVTVTTFGRVVDSQPNGFMFQNDFVAQVGEMQNVVRGVGTATTGIVSMLGYKVYTPFINRATKFIVNTLDLFGFSMPLNYAKTEIMQIRQPLYLKTCDTPSAINMAPMMNNEIKSEYKLTNCDINELDIVKFCMRPALLYTGIITSTDLAGTIIFNIPLTPGAMYCTKLADGIVSTANFPAPMAFINKMFNYWRGSMKFTISFVKSNFHNARLRIMYRPYLTINSTEPNEIQSCDVENITIDLSTQSEVTFIIPFQQQTEFQETYKFLPDNLTLQDYAIHCNGLVQMMLINSLTSGVSPVNPIYYQVWVSGCEDLEFAMPAIDGILESGFIAQIGETTTVTSDGECKFAACTMETTQNANAVIMGRGSPHFSNFTRCASQVYSLLAMAKMLQPKLFATTAYTNTTFYINPSGPMNIRGASTTENPQYLHYYSMLQSVFRYWRGGVRLNVIPDGFETKGSVTLSQDYTTFFSYDTPSDPLLASSVYAGSSLVVSQNLTITPLDVVVPYNSRLNCKLTNVGATPNESSLGQNARFTIVPIGGASTGSVSMLKLKLGANVTLDATTFPIIWNVLETTGSLFNYDVATGEFWVNVDTRVIMNAFTLINNNEYMSGTIFNTTDNLEVLLYGANANTAQPGGSFNGITFSDVLVLTAGKKYVMRITSTPGVVINSTYTYLRMTTLLSSSTSPLGTDKVTICMGGGR